MFTSQKNNRKDGGSGGIGSGLKGGMDPVRMSMLNGSSLGSSYDRSHITGSVPERTCASWKKIIDCKIIIFISTHTRQKDWEIYAIFFYIFFTFSCRCVELDQRKLSRWISAGNVESTAKSGNNCQLDSMLEQQCVALQAISTLQEHQSTTATDSVQHRCLWRIGQQLSGALSVRERASSAAAHAALCLPQRRGDQLPAIP